MELLNLEEQPKASRKRQPETKGEYQKLMAQVTKRDLKVICILTSHWRLDWFRDMHSEIKWQRDKSKHPIIVNSWIKKAKLKRCA